MFCPLNPITHRTCVASTEMTSLRPDFYIYLYFMNSTCKTWRMAKKLDVRKMYVVKQTIGGWRQYGTNPSYRRGVEIEHVRTMFVRKPRSIFRTCSNFCGAWYKRISFCYLVQVALVDNDRRCYHSSADRNLDPCDFGLDHGPCGLSWCAHAQYLPAVQMRVNFSLPKAYFLQLFTFYMIEP